MDILGYFTGRKLNKLHRELEKKLSDKFKQNISDSKLEQIVGGADAQIYSFLASGEDISRNLIIRIFRKVEGDTRARDEFIGHDKLYKAGISVPEPIMYELNSVIGQSYMVMEKVSGQSMLDLLYNSSDAEKRDLFTEFIKLMRTFHNIPLGNAKGLEINPDPYYYSNLMIDEAEHRIIAWENRTGSSLDDFKKIITWCRKNIIPSDFPVLIHGDFHPTNVLVREDGSMVAIDLSNVNIMDIRFEIGFTYAVLSHPMFSGYNDLCIKLYEEEAGMKIENLDFFIIISNLHNALRMYSCAFDYSITNENDVSSDFFYGYVKGYTQTVFERIKQSTGVELLPISQRLQS